MDSSNTSAVSMYSAKTVTIHTILIVSVCAAFGIINIVSKAVAVGAVTLGMGIVVLLVITMIRKRTQIATQGFFLSIVQLLTIIVISVAKHELHTMFALMLTSMAVSALYCSVKCLITHWIVMDLASLIGVAFRGFFYGDESLEVIFKGILSINVGAFVLVYLIKVCVKFIDSIHVGQKNSERLVDEVNAKMDDVNRLMENQKGVVNSVSEITANLSDSISGLKDISLALSSSAEEQQRTIVEITDDITRLGDETNKSLEAASQARTAANESTRMLTENNAEVDKMLSAMEEINHSSVEIGTIIKTIEDIAFQTNILALNASIEAARAGDLGKGFAVVADEVRNLATKSDEAAKSTSVLISSSIKSVESGSTIAQSVADKMKEAIDVSKQSAEFSVMIEKLTESQNESMDSMRVKMDEISAAVAKGLDVSVKNTEIAQAVADEVQRLNETVANV